MFGWNLAFDEIMLTTRPVSPRSANKGSTDHDFYSNPHAMTAEPSSSPETKTHVCCLVEDRERCTRLAGNASYSNRIQKTVQQRKLKFTVDHSANHIYICNYHKNMIQNLRAKRKRKDSERNGSVSENNGPRPEINFFQMPVNTLRRYKRHYKLQTRPGLNKAQLADTVARHFKTIPVVEKEALTFFIYMAKSHKSRLDNKHLEGLSS